MRSNQEGEQSRGQQQSGKQSSPSSSPQSEQPRSGSSQSGQQQSESMKASPATIERYLKGADFPASRGDLCEQARENDAPQEIMQMLKNMPDREYRTAADVTKSVSEARPRQQ